MLGIAQQCNKAGNTSAKYEDSVHSPPMYSHRAYFRNLIMDDMDWGTRVLDLR